MDDDDIKRIPPVGRRGGVWVRFGLDEYRVPPLALEGVKAVQEAVALFGTISTDGLPTQEQMAGAHLILHTALTRNYPDLTLEEVAAMVDLSNFMSAMEAVLGQSGFVRKTGGPALGETTASIGMNSTSALSMPSVGHGSM